MGVLRETEHGLIVTEANQFKFGNNHELQKTNILVVRKFLRDLMEAGVEVPGAFDEVLAHDGAGAKAAGVSATNPRSLT